MINLVLSIYEIWPTLSYPFFRIWSTLSYLFIKYDQPCLIYLWVWGLICHLAFTESAPENLSTTKTVSNNYFVNKYEFFKSTPMIFFININCKWKFSSTSTATNKYVHHWLQPLGWLFFVSHSIYPIYGGKMTFLHPLRQRPLNVVSEILKLAWAGFRSGTSFLGFWFDTVPRIDPVVFSIWMFYQFYYRQRNISTSYKHSRCLKKKAPPKTNEALTCYWTILFLQNG